VNNKPWIQARPQRSSGKRHHVAAGGFLDRIKLSRTEGAFDKMDTVSTYQDVGRNVAHSVVFVWLFPSGWRQHCLGLERLSDDLYIPD
jgi:hypothetical protein